MINHMQFQQNQNKFNLLNGLDSIIKTGKNLQMTAKLKGAIMKGLGGEYNNDGKKQDSGRKYFRIIEMSIYSSQTSLVTNVGEYNLEGYKMCKWDFKYEGQKIGRGCCEEKEGLKKFGKWVDLSQGFTDKYQFSCSLLPQRIYQIQMLRLLDFVKIISINFDFKFDQFNF